MDNSDVTGKAKSVMFIGMLSTYASHPPVWVTTHTRSIVTRARCRGTETTSIRYGTAYHAYRRDVYIYSSISPTEDSGDRERLSKSRGQGITYEMYSSHTCMYLVRTYIVLDERLIDPWYLVLYYNVDRIGYRGRTSYYSSEASFWLIHPPQKICPCVCSTNIGFSVENIVLVLVWGTYYVPYVIGISRQKSHHVRIIAW